MIVVFITPIYGNPSMHDRGSFDFFELSILENPCLYTMFQTYYQKYTNICKVSACLLQYKWQTDLRLLKIDTIYSFFSITKTKI